MKKTTLSRLLAFLLVAIMAVSVLAACGGNDEPGKTPGGTDDGGFTHTPENPEIPAKDYDGYTFTFVCQPYMDSQAYSVNYMVSESETSNVLLDAVYRRNELLKEKYNINFEQMQVTDLVTTVRTQVMGGATEFDMIIGNCKRLANLAKENLLLELSSIERFDMTKSYWDSNAAEQLKVGNKLYFTNCDLNVQEVAFVVYFNKALITEFELTSPYEYMKNNQWTIDNWANLVMAVSKDMDGGGTWDENDKYGTLYERHNARMFLFGTGVRATTNDETGYPVVTLFDTDKAVTVYEKCKAVFNSINTWSIEEMSSSDTHGYNDKWDYARSLFCQDHYLFYYDGTRIIDEFKDMESEFGMMPFPKYDSSQVDYYTLYPHDGYLIAVPKVVEDIERTGKIIEDLNFYSSIIVKPAWYDTLLCRRYTRDDESEKSLDLILEGRVYDLGLIYDFGGLRTNFLEKDARTFDMTERNFKRALRNNVEAYIKQTYRDIES